MAFNFLQSPWQLFKAAARADTLEYLIITPDEKNLEIVGFFNIRVCLAHGFPYLLPTC